MSKQNLKSNILDFLETDGPQKPTLFGVRVDTQGRLVFDASPTIPETRFSYQGIPFTLCFAREEKAWKVSLYGFLGVIPYSSEDRESRTFFLTLLCALRAQGHLLARPEITPEQHLIVAYHTLFPERLTTTSVFGALVQPLWELNPTLALLRSYQS